MSEEWPIITENMIQKKKDEATKEWNEEVTCRLADALEGIYKEI